MAYRGRGRGRGGFGGGGFRPAKQDPFELFPAIEGLGTAKYSTENIQLIKWSAVMQKYWSSSPYYYEDRRQRPEKEQKPDIEKYSDRKLQATKARSSSLFDFIVLDPAHIPAELARGKKKGKHVAKKIRWNPESGQDIFEKLEKMNEGEGEEDGTEKKENEEEDEEDGENEEEEGEYSDEGDYEQAEYCDDDEDDYNMDDDNDGTHCLARFLLSLVQQFVSCLVRDASFLFYCH
ncbi:hypothetical protein DH2020_043512 [Rehmannia glutinosa]|uniref:DNA-directed RNA polymerase III subunit n=1 Tax=Rehmannia glutinosa TaxID=99300 RepID=A0ABR0UKC5_REHGL